MNRPEGSDGYLWSPALSTVVMKPSLTSTEPAASVLEEVALPAPLKVVAFWSAVALPFVAIGLLASGLETTLEFALLGTVLLANVVALVVGHDYGTSEAGQAGGGTNVG